MWRKFCDGLWAFLMLAVAVHAAQNPKDDQSKESRSKDSKSKEDKSKDDKPKEQKISARGKVVDRDGGDVSNAVVTIAGPKGPITTTTDSTGSYSFEGPAGKYTITAKAGGKSGSFTDDVAGNKELKSLKIE
jgi:hypothetical protein